MIGGLIGLILSNVGVDLGLYDIYYVVVYFYFILSLGVVVGVFLGLYYIDIELLGRRLLGFIGYL